MNETDLIQMLITKFPIIFYILTGLGTIVVLAQIYIAMTPTQKDDLWYSKIESIPVIKYIIEIFIRFAPIQRKRTEAKERTTDKSA